MSLCLACAAFADTTQRGGVVEVDGTVATFPYSIEIGNGLLVTDPGNGTVLLSATATGGGGGGGSGVTSITQGTGLSFSVSPLVSTGTINLATPVSLANGGTNTAITADNGAIPYSNASALVLLASTATANKALLSGASAAPVWSTPTFPNASATTGKYIRSDGTNWIASTGSASGIGTPTACTNQFVTGLTLASDAAPTSVCTTATLASAQFVNQGTTTTVLHGNAAGNPSFAAVILNTDTTGNYVASANTATLTGLTGGSAGSAAAALALALDETTAMSGSPALGADAEVFGVSGIAFEGTTADTIETFLTVTDPTVIDKTITFPNATGTVAVSATSPVTLSAAGDIGLTTPLSVGNGGTGVATFTLNGVLYGNAATSVLVTAQGPTNSVLTASAGAPSFSTNPTVGSLTITGANDAVRLTVTGNATQTTNLATFQNSASTAQLTLTNAGVGTFNGNIVVGGSGLSTITQGVKVASGNGTTANDELVAKFHLRFGPGGSTPVVSACGSAPNGALSTGSTDNAGIITIGGGVVTSCTLTFGVSFTSAPACTVSDNGTAVTTGSSASATVLTITSSATFGGAIVPYICMGING